MEILSNFSSAYCFISFILGALFMLTILSIAAMGKVQEPINNVHYYVTKDWSHTDLWLGKPEWNRMLGVWYAGAKHAITLCHGYSFDDYKLNLDDYFDMKNGEIREVFINMED